MIEQIRPAQLAPWLAEHALLRPVVLDVREAIEVATASVQPDGFELLHIPMSEITGQLAQIDPDRPLACLCHHGTRSHRVAVFLAQNGFGPVVNIAGGIDAWSVELDPGVARY